MSINQLPEKKTRVAPTGRPLQRLSWSDKIGDDYEWWKSNIDYGIARAGLFSNNKGTRNPALLYDIYNNRFPLEWFTHITDPLSAKRKENKQYPAKIRPTSMLRTNIDLLLGDYPNRPFVYTVSNMGEDAYNSFLENKAKAIQSNVQEHFLAAAQAEMQAAGHDVQQVPQDGQIPLPEEIQDRFTSGYKDNLARRGQKVVDRMIREYNVRSKHLKMFKDWLIAGTTYSYKNIENGNFIYERVSSLELDYMMSPDKDFIEDAERVTRRQMMTVSDIVDKFYDELTESDHNDLETRAQWASPMSMFNYFTDNHSLQSGLVPLYHIVWKGKKPIKHVTYTDPFSGEVEQLVLDESTPMDDTMKLTKTEWVNEVYEGWRIGDNIYTRMRPLPVQRNEMNNFSTCKLPYNGRCYSNTHSENISVMEMGIPYAIMYMVSDYLLEKTIAKNKGKIAQIDINSMPRTNGWDEEKVLYYADALGYMMVDRNQQGVDKSWNSQHVLDMSLFDQIKELINLRDSFANGWDKLLGITPQRKAEINSSAGMGTTNAAINQSSVMTNMIYMLFEEFTEKELQGILDLSRFTNVEGVKGIYNEDDYDKELLGIDPNSYCNAELGILISNSTEQYMILQKYKESVQAMIQNGVKQSTILEIQKSNNIAELLGKLKRLEAIEAQQAQDNAANEQEHEAAMEQMKEKYLTLESQLKITQIDEEYDRKNELEMIKGEYSIYSAANIKGDGDADNNGVPDAVEVSKRVIANEKLLSDERTKNREISSREKIHGDQMKMEDKHIALEKDKLASKERIEKVKARAKPKGK